MNGNIGSFSSKDGLVIGTGNGLSGIHDMKE